MSSGFLYIAASGIKGGNMQCFAVYSCRTVNIKVAGFTVFLHHLPLFFYSSYSVLFFERFLFLTHVPARNHINAFLHYP